MMRFGDAVAIDGGEIDLSLCIDGGEIGLFYNKGGPQPVYPGPYSVIPDFVGSVLSTANKAMSSDVTVAQIPVAEVSNPQGGITVTIGG